VKAMGITVSVEQFKKTKERITQLGLQDRVEVQLIDYRELAATGRTFDKITSGFLPDGRHRYSSNLILQGRYPSSATDTGLSVYIKTRLPRE
jgi:hypothetical protein